MNETQTMVEEYIGFVQESIKKFNEIGDLIQGNEVPPAKVNKALSLYYDTCISLNAEYQRYKIEKLGLELEYESLYADWFSSAKETLIAENAGKSAKPALKEIEQLIKSEHKVEYFAWQRKLTVAESKCDFYIRMRETLNKYDSVLTNLAMSLRSELRALNIESRANTREKFAPRRIQDLAEQASR